MPRPFYPWRKSTIVMRFLSVIFLAAYLCSASPAIAEDRPLVVSLWPDKAPEETGDIGEEKVIMSPKLDRKQVEVTESTRMITNVTRPIITIYRPAKNEDT